MSYIRVLPCEYYKDECCILFQDSYYGPDTIWIPKERLIIHSDNREYIEVIRIIGSDRYKVLAMTSTSISLKPEHIFETLP